MSSKNEFIEQQQDSINEEWANYCHEIQQIRHKYGLDSIVFTKEDKEKFAISYIESRLVWLLNNKSISYISYKIISEEVNYGS